MKKHSAKGEVKVLAIDLAKQSFQLHGVDESGQSVLRKTLSRNKVSAFVAPVTAVSDRVGGLWGRQSLGESVQRVWAYGTDDGTAVCQALCEIQQE